MSKTTIKQAIDGFLLNCKVEGKSWGTIDCYADKLYAIAGCIGSDDNIQLEPRFTKEGTYGF